jgi:hypothetical protein
LDYKRSLHVINLTLCGPGTSPGTGIGNNPAESGEFADLNDR